MFYHDDPEGLLRYDMTTATKQGISMDAEENELKVDLFVFSNFNSRYHAYMYYKARFYKISDLKSPKKTAAASGTPKTSSGLADAHHYYYHYRLYPSGHQNRHYHRHQPYLHHISYTTAPVADKLKKGSTSQYERQEWFRRGTRSKPYAQSYDMPPPLAPPLFAYKEPNFKHASCHHYHQHHAHHHHLPHRYHHHPSEKDVVVVDEDEFNTAYAPVAAVATGTGTTGSRGRLAYPNTEAPLVYSPFSNQSFLSIKMLKV